jgi:hypothetical protein
MPFGLPCLLASRTIPTEVRPEFCAVFSRRRYLTAVRGETAAIAESGARSELSSRLAICRSQCFPMLRTKSGSQAT